MRVLIKYEQIVIGENSVEYYPYYFGIWDREIDYRLTVKKVLSQWAAALSRLKSSGRPVYLPYSLDDESCKFLKAELGGGEVLLTDIEVWANGYSMNLDDLSGFMYSEPEVAGSFVDYFGNTHEDPTKFFGKYDLAELVGGLESARVSDE